MINIYLFDWGDTLMVDFPNASGKMCDWETVETIPGAKETLEFLSTKAKIYIATGAADSTELEIKKAFERVGLSQFISGYFCKENLGISKDSSEFFNTILTKLRQTNRMISPENIAMVGDNVDKDIKPAIAAGMQAFWITERKNESILKNVTVINKLNQLVK